VKEWQQQTDAEYWQPVVPKAEQNLPLPMKVATKRNILQKQYKESKDFTVSFYFFCFHAVKTQ
jgi:hypothetical protein